MPTSLKGTGSWCALLTEQLNVLRTKLIRSTLHKCTAQEAQQGVTALSKPTVRIACPDTRRFPTSP